MDGAERRHVANLAERDELGPEVAHGRSLQGERPHRQPGGVRRRLAKEAVPRPSADDEDPPERAAGKALEGAAKRAKNAVDGDSSK